MVVRSAVSLQSRCGPHGTRSTVLAVANGLDVSAAHTAGRAQPAAVDGEVAVVACAGHRQAHAPV